MSNMGLVLFILFAISSVSSLGVSLYFVRETIKNKIIKIDINLLFKKLIIVGLIFIVSLTIMFISIYWWNHLIPRVEDLLATIFGAPFFGLFLYTSLHSFLLHYFCKMIDNGVDKKLFICLMVSFPLMLVFLFLLSNGFADYLNKTAPLINGINFETGWNNPFKGHPNLTFYALCILSGAIYVYFYCDHKFFLKYGKHGLLESTFLVAFPAGILGARIWYVVGVYNEQYKGASIGQMLDMTKGGLTILGGAITGIIVGVLWFMYVHRNRLSILFAVDTIVPSILIAQAVGRWGNFFNLEVHGELVNETYWRWLPKIIFNNSHFSESAGLATSGHLFVPLFFVECLTNLLGFFVITHLFGVCLKKYLKPGDLAFGYIVWYGMARVLLEPLRYVDYQMNTWSWIWSVAFLIIGMFLVGINHLIRTLIEKRNNTYKPLPYEKKRGLIATIIISLTFLSFIAIGLTMMLTTKFVPVLEFNQFNTGLIFLFSGIAISMLLMIYIPYMFNQEEIIHE